MLVHLCLLLGSASVSMNAENSLLDKIEGMLIGSAIGDAAGGPVEFVHPPTRSIWTQNKEPITDEGKEALGKLYAMSAYPKKAKNLLLNGKTTGLQERSQTIRVLRSSSSMPEKIWKRPQPKTIR